MAEKVHQILEALQNVKAEKVAGFVEVLDQDQAWLAQQIAERKAFLAKLRPRPSRSEPQAQPPRPTEEVPADENAPAQDKVPL